MRQVRRRLSFHGTSQKDKPATAGTKHGKELKTACISSVTSYPRNDKRFLRMMEMGTHKKQQGNRE
ncbi:unnamed protein product, partial [Porites evermanni]